MFFFSIFLMLLYIHSLFFSHCCLLLLQVAISTAIVASAVVAVAVVYSSHKPLCVVARSAPSPFSTLPSPLRLSCLSCERELSLSVFLSLLWQPLLEFSRKLFWLVLRHHESADEEKGGESEEEKERKCDEKMKGERGEKRMEKRGEKKTRLGDTEGGRRKRKERERKKGQEETRELTSVCSNLSIGT